MRKQDQYINELDQENKKMDQKGPTDMRNYFGDVSEDNKKIPRAAPAPITREKLEASNQRDNMGMTQLKKRDVNIPNLTTNNMANSDAANITEHEVAHKLNPLVDSDMYENISDDDDGLLDSPEKEDKNVSGGGNVIGGGINKGRGGSTRGRGIPGQDKRGGTQRGVGTRGMDSRGGRGDRGSRGGGGRDKIRGVELNVVWEPEAWIVVEVVVTEVVVEEAEGAIIRVNLARNIIHFPLMMSQRKVRKIKRILKKVAWT